MKNLPLILGVIGLVLGASAFVMQHSRPQRHYFVAYNGARNDGSLCLGQIGINSNWPFTFDTVLSWRQLIVDANARDFPIDAPLTNVVILSITKLEN